MPETKAAPLGVLQNPSGGVAGLYRLAQSRGEQYGPGWGCVQVKAVTVPPAPSTEPVQGAFVIPASRGMAASDYSDLSNPGAGVVSDLPF